MPKRVTTEEFIKQAREVHGDKYDYSQTVYKYAREKVTIICPIHGPFKQEAYSHKKGHGCDKCANELRADNLFLGKEEFVRRAKKSHGDKFGYDKVEYKGVEQSVEIYCNSCHSYFWQLPRVHIDSKYACRTCRSASKRERASKVKLTNDDFIKRARAKHGDRYDYSLARYTKQNKKVKIICRKHGVFEQRPNNHISRGQGCPSCNGGVKKELEDYHALAKSRGLKWLGPEVSNGKTKTEWRCSCGYKWMATYGSIWNSKKGCARCAGNYTKSESDYHELAKQKGVKWVGKLPKSVKLKTRWICDKGHKFSTTYDSLSGATANGCQKCRTERNQENQRLKLEDYTTLAEENGFKWLGPEVPNNQTKTWWKCSNGHKFDTTYGAIQSGGGCRFCAGNTKRTQADYRELAQTRGFEWVDTDIVNVDTPTRWKCSDGHEWETTYYNIGKGAHCPECFSQLNRSTKTDEDYYELGKRQGISWLGPFPKNVLTKTCWQCKKGHKWESAYHNVDNGRGCPVCKTPHGEKKIAKALMRWGIQYARQKTFKKCRHKKPLHFDFYILLDGYQILIEFDGMQHYEPVEAWGGEERLKIIQLRDSIKNNFAKKYGFYLIRIPYWDIDKIEAILYREIEHITGRPPHQTKRKPRSKEQHEPLEGFQLPLI